MLKSVNPLSNQLLRKYAPHSDKDAAAIVADTAKAFQGWKARRSDERAECLRAVAKRLRDRQDKLAQLITDEMGKVIAESRAEIEKCAWVCEYYADTGERFLKTEIAETDAKQSFVAFAPIGVVLAVMPWNFPFWQVFRFAAPALMAGNVGLLKHASNVSGCALAIESVFADSGVEQNAFRTLLISSDQVAQVIENKHVRAVTLTGSGPAGRAVAAVAGRALKKSVLELGGSDPYIVLHDADLNLAVDICVKSRLINAGQSCIAAKRFIVVDEVYDAFVERFVETMRRVTFGDPNDPSSGIGPLARIDLRDELHAQVQKSVSQGARCVLGGEIPAMKGAFYPPTVLTDVEAGMLAYTEELFGPVATIIRARDEDDAIRIANDTPFGLSSAIFSRDIERAERIATKEIDAGGCFINAFTRSDPRLPFGGIKDSGYGRELSSYGIREFVNIKTIYVD
ncbi:MAG: NAD-dependent succinate-semialdehyde dehydrogenase [Polyangiales bacterium]